MIFLHGIHKHKDQNFLQPGRIVFTDIDRHTQSTQNSKSVMSLQYIKRRER